ncbi:hypothetical protein IGB42_02609 [Andreprevotia sp. IGB-42]|uniref:hypothetical protein n=1 Tax=Andreprevotia sp. IGB-42 TaxID=2497473 RepID=UPI00135BB1DD|nr:hypothetical protein [Andreprevotia sp. IGB-42]KAF0812766.1 hypothetical protein IGB42_02609 [Andreprevotia sp. IGB-42]
MSEIAVNALKQQVLEQFEVGHVSLPRLMGLTGLPFYLLRIALESLIEDGVLRREPAIFGSHVYALAHVMHPAPALLDEPFIPSELLKPA